MFWLLDVAQRCAVTCLTVSACYAVYATCRYFTSESSEKTEANNQMKALDVGNHIFIGHVNDGGSLMKQVVTEQSHIDERTYRKVQQRLRKIAPDEDIVVHLQTPGGAVFWSEMIANLLLHHKGKVTAQIHGFCSSGGTLIALSCNEIYMPPGSALGPIDPQAALDGAQYVACVDFLQALGIDVGTLRNKSASQLCAIIDDSVARAATLKEHELRRRALQCVKGVADYIAFVDRVLERRYADVSVRNTIAERLLWTHAHDTPLFRDYCIETGLHIY